MVAIPHILPLPQDENALHEAQIKWASEVILRPFAVNSVRYVAAADVAYQEDQAFAAVVVTDSNGQKIVDQAVWIGKSPADYSPGLFVLRESACLLEAFRLLQTIPDVVLIEGHGTAHPRRFGLACYLGMSLDLPTVGCAKTPLYGQIGAIGHHRGDQGEIRDQSGVMIGCALRTQDGVKPVYVSPGQYVDLASAVALILRLSSSFRIPDPLRLAHQRSVIVRREGT